MAVRRELTHVVSGIAVAALSSPISLMVIDSHFGLGSALVVPAFAVGAWFMLKARLRERRAWWFGFAVTIGLCLPLCPGIVQRLAEFARLLQKHSLLSQRIIEPACLILAILIPWAIACFLGIVGGKLAKRLARSGSPVDAAGEPGVQPWRFSLRELLIAVAAISLLFAWNGRSSTGWRNAEARNQALFLARFKQSFTSGELKLLAEPKIVEQQRTLMPESRYLSFRPPEVNEYRIVAPIDKNGQKLWAVWAYTCNDNANDLVYQYAYAEAAAEDRLPAFPNPAKRYIEGTWKLIDGTPFTAGPSATVVSTTSPARANQLLVLTARAPAGTMCELVVFPKDAVTSPLLVAPDKKGMVRWSLNISPRYAGSVLSYELRCLQPRGPSHLVNTTRGNLYITAP